MKRIYSNIRYYFRRLKNMDYQGFLKAIDYAHKKSGKSKVFIFFDMMWASFKYTAGYVDYNEFEYYLMNDKQRKTYLTLGDSHKVVRLYNDSQYMDLLDDKTQFVKEFKEYISREHIDLRETNFEDFKVFVNKHPQIMAKRHNDYVGRGIDKIDFKTNPDLNLKQCYDDLLENKQYLIEVFFQQHPKMDELSDKSVNTLRIITFLDDENIPQVLVRVLKSGLGKHLDNIGQGGMYTILNEEGIVDAPFIDQYGNHYLTNPLNGKDLIGFAVPNYKHVENQVKEACLKVPQVRYVGWDVAISPEGNAELIEGNTETGPFQMPFSISKTKEGVKPIYEKYMDFKK